MEYRQVPPQYNFPFGTWNVGLEPPESSRMETNMQHEQAGSANGYGECETPNATRVLSPNVGQGCELVERHGT
jgi:hypothetical protein